MHSRIFEILEKGQEPTLSQWTFDDGTCLEYYGIDYVSEMDEEETTDSIDWMIKNSDGAIVYDKEAKSIKFDKKKLMEIDYNTGLLPENEFLRKLKDGETYYLGNILDYHM